MTKVSIFTCTCKYFCDMGHFSEPLQLAEAFVRIICGVLFLFQGYDKLFVVKIKNVASAYEGQLKSPLIPTKIIILFSLINSLLEFFGGALLCLGLFTEISYTLLAFNLIVVCIAFSFTEPVWDMKHVFPRIILLTLTIVFHSHFYFGLDHFNFV